MLKQFGLSTIEQIIASDLSLEDKLARILSRRHFSRAQKVQCAKQFIALGVDVTTRNDLLLRWAAENGFADVVMMVLAKGADMNVLAGEPLVRSAVNNHFDVVQLLLKNGANHRIKDYAAFRICAAVGNLAMMQLLLQHKTEVAVRHNFALKKAYVYQQGEIVAYLMRHYRDTIVNQAKVDNDEWVLRFCQQYPLVDNLQAYQEKHKMKSPSLSIH